MHKQQRELVMANKGKKDGGWPAKKQNGKSGGNRKNNPPKKKGK